MSQDTIPLERRVRSRDPETSWEAAESITESKLTKLQDAILEELSKADRTDDELVFALWWLGVTPQRVRTARKELELQGRVEWTGEYGRTSSGRKTQIWGLA